MKSNEDRLARSMFALSLALLVFGYGVAVGTYEIFPHRLIHESIKLAKSLVAQQAPGAKPWYYRTADPDKDISYTSDAAYPGLNLLVTIAADDRLAVRVTDMAGEDIHRWYIDWFEIWPQPEHIADSNPLKPKSRPGTLVHGLVLMDNGDLVFNFEYLGLVRLNPCGEVVWRLPYSTHHSVHLDEDGTLWVSGRKNHLGPVPGLPNYQPPFSEPTVLQVSPDGEILQEFSVIELLQNNGLHGLLYLGTQDNQSTVVSGDTLHLNDVETFPPSMSAGLFSRGDVMISLRNINAVLVFDQRDGNIKYLSIGQFVRQHDADFLDGNTISVYDNNNTAKQSEGYQSRILRLTTGDDNSEIVYSGSQSLPFYSDIMGKHQWLPNGNLLITETRGGRAFEVDSQGEIVWQLLNRVDATDIGALGEAQRISGHFTTVFEAAQCSP